MTAMETGTTLMDSTIKLDKAESILQTFIEDAYYDMPELTEVQQASNIARHELHSNLLYAVIDYIRATRADIEKLEAADANI